MSIQILPVNYSTRNHPTGNGFALANIGQIITESVNISTNFEFQSSSNEQVLIVSPNQIRILGGLWAEKGYVVGDSVTPFGEINNGGAITTLSGIRTILLINGDTMTVTLSFPASVIGQIMPMQGGASSNSVFGLFNNTRSQADTIEFYHNLSLNDGNGSQNSLLDGEVNRFEVLGVGAMAIGAILTPVQIGNKSGGSYILYEFERLANVANNNWSFASIVTAAYQVRLSYAIPLNFENPDFIKPSWFEINSSVKPFYDFKGLSQDNNPNSFLYGRSAPLLGNIGWRDESYNQGLNEFTVESVVITTSTGVIIPEVDSSQNCTVTAVITHPTLNFLELAEVNFSLVPELDLVKNLPSRNCDLIQLSNFFIDSTPTVTSQVFGTGGAEIQTSAESLNVATANQIIVRFTTNPNAAFTSLIDSMSLFSRRYTITATVESVGGDANNNNSVTLTLKQGLLELAPIVGLPYPVREQGFFNHANDLTGASAGTYKGCTEDDFLYRALFDLEQNDIWNALNVKVQVVRNSDFTTFDLVSKTINLTNYITNVDGEIQVNYTEPITQYLDNPNRNVLSATLTGNDVGTKYEVQILWSLMASWRYWIAQNNAFIDFFDGTLPNNGMNAEWMRYLRVAGYSMRVRVELVDDANTADYFGAPIELQDYEDTAEVTTTLEYFDSSGDAQTSWVANDIMTIRARHTLAVGSWNISDVWGWISVRPFETEPNKRISSVWDWTAQNNPLAPPVGETKATLTFPTPDVALVECRVNTGMISIGTATAIARIESPKNPTCVSPIDYLFDMVVASSDNELDYIEALETLLINGVIAKSICCPECDVLNNITGLNDKVYQFGGDVTEDNPASPYNGSLMCCTDSYGTFSGCNASFDADWDAFVLTVAAGGDTAFLTGMTPSQMNLYGNASMAIIISKIQAITVDPLIQYNLMFVLLNKGLQVACLNGGGSVISEIDTLNPDGTPKATTEGDYKVTTQGDYKITKE